MFGIALLVSFLLEVFAVGAMSYSGFRLPLSIEWQFCFGIVLPVVVIVFWANYMSPKAKKRLKNPYYLLSKGVIYAIPAIFLAVIGQATIALIFAIIVILDEAILLQTPQNPRE